jgi:hypothetical protein
MDLGTTTLKSKCAAKISLQIIRSLGID